MAYEKQNFADGQVLKAENLNHIEDGIKEIEKNYIPISGSDNVSPTFDIVIANKVIGRCINNGYLSS